MTLPVRRGRYSARRWDPFAGFAGFDNLFDQMSRMLTSAFPEAARISVNSWAPPVDIEETDEAYLVEADVPGVRPEDVEIDLQGRELRIRGEYGTAEQGEGEAQRVRRTGHFDYRLTLPGEVSSESCTADIEHGVLRLRLPKAPSSVRQRIPVQTTRPSAQLGSGESLKNSDQPQTPTT
jgi:HSP20 family protein